MSVRLAEALHAPIVSADSRQIYREMEIGTARPGEDELSRARFYFVGSASVRDAYSAARYEAEALPLIASLHTANPYVILSGGSMLYVDAVISGIDYIPDVRPEVRARQVSWLWLILWVVTVLVLGFVIVSLISAL